MPETAAEKTEQPTSRRLGKAKEEGNVPSSMELVNAVTLVALLAITAFMGPKFVEWANGEIKEGMSCQVANIHSPSTFIRFSTEKFMQTVIIASPFFLALIVAGTGINLAISGYNPSMKTLKLKLDQLNPVNGVKKLFSMSSLVKLLLSIIKIVFVALIVSTYIRSKMEILATYQWAWSTEILKVISYLIVGASIRLCLGLLIIGFIDLAYQKYKYIKNLMMTKQEVKDELKNQEGPPEIKRHIRQKQFEAAMRRMIQDVPKAKVVLVNPTHVAVALQYEPETMHAPVVIAKGGDHVCEKIKEVARAYGIPIIRRPELARRIFSTVKLGKAIPEELFVAVAEVMALIYRLKRAR